MHADAFPHRSPSVAAERPRWIEDGAIDWVHLWYFWDLDDWDRHRHVTLDPLIVELNSRLELGDRRERRRRSA